MHSDGDCGVGFGIASCTHVHFGGPSRVSLFTDIQGTNVMEHRGQELEMKESNMGKIFLNIGTGRK